MSFLRFRRRFFQAVVEPVTTRLVKIAIGPAVNTVSPDITAPPVPTGLTATAVGASQINVSWNPSVDVAGFPGEDVSGTRDYLLYRSSDNVTYTLRTTTTGTSFSDTGLSGGVTYYYKVAARDMALNESAQSSAVSATTPSASNVEPGHYPLELVLPRAVGTRASNETVSGTLTPAIGANHRIFRAYPGIEYNIPTIAIGGAFPYTYELSGIDWLSIDPSTGVISGTAPNVPNGTQYTGTVTVRDALNTTVSASWTVTVTTSGFKFVDATNGNDTTGTGTRANPWRTFERMKAASVAGDIVYFREGIYTSNITPDSQGGSTGEFTPPGNWRRIQFSASSNSTQWLAYPGETVIIDGGHVAGVSQGNLIRMTGNSSTPVYLDGLEFQNFYHIMLQITVGGHYEVFRRLDMRDLAQVIDGANSACIDSTSNIGGAPRFYVTYQDCDFHNNLPGGCKIYWQYKSLIDRCQFRDSGGFNPVTGDRGSGGPDHKAVCGRFEVRASLFDNHPSTSDVPTDINGVPINGAMADSGFGGNMNDDIGFANIQASGEVRFNRFGNFDRPDLRVVNMNNFGVCAEIYIYRNTGVGRWNVENSDLGGPYTFYRNVIINDVNAGLPDRISVSGNAPGNRGSIVLGTGNNTNITGGTSDNIVDPVTLELLEPYRSQYLGTRGHEIA